MTNSEPQRRLNPDHAAALAKRGISEDLARNRGLRSRTAAEINKILGRGDVTSGGIEIPYPGTDYHRYRLDVPLERPGQNAAKYLAPAGIGNRLYVSPGLVDRLRTDASLPLVVIEGEFKALAVAHALALPVAGISGCWSWSDKERASGLIADFEPLLGLLRKRPVLIGLDSDARTNLHVAKAAARLGDALRACGAAPRWAFAPQLHPGKKTGLDDLLVEQGGDAVRDVLDHAIEPVEPACYVLRQVVEEVAKVPHEGGFVGTPGFETLRSLIQRAPKHLRGALSKEVQEGLCLNSCEREALLAAASDTSHDAGKADSGQSPDDALQGTALSFEQIEPWKEMVEGKRLLADLIAFLRRFVVLAPHAAEALALWLLHVYALDAAEYSLIVHITAPTKRAGKSRLLNLLSLLVPRPLRASSASVSALFRAIDRFQPTVLLDEADTFVPGREDVRGLLNSCHSKLDATFLRAVGDDHEPRLFRTWAPCVVAGIGGLPATVADRSLRIEMRPRLRHERIERLRETHVRRDAEPLRRQADRWAKDHVAALRDADPEVPDALDDRATDGWRPLFAIAEAVGGDWPQRARAAAVALTGRPACEEDDQPLGVLLLRDIHIAFGTDERLSTETLLERLIAMQDRPWPRCCRDRPLHAQRLAQLLRPFGIVPGSVRLANGHTPKGYRREAFLDAWARYLDEPQDKARPGTSPCAETPAATTPHATGTEDCEPRDDPPRPIGVAEPEAPSDAGDDVRVAPLRRARATGALQQCQPGVTHPAPGEGCAFDPLPECSDDEGRGA